MLNKIIPEKNVVKNYEVDHKFEKLGRRVMIVNVRQLRDILDLSKIEAGKMELTVSGFSLKELLEYSLTFVKEKASTRRIELFSDIAEDVEFIQADERKIKQIILNLLSLLSGEN